MLFYPGKPQVPSLEHAASCSASPGCAPVADRGLTFPGTWCLNFICAKTVADSQTLAWNKYWFTRSCASPSTVGSQLRRRRPVWASFWFWKGKSCFVFTSFFFTSAVFLFFRWQIMEWEDSMSPTLTLHGQVKNWRRARPGEAWASGLGHTLFFNVH